ncbi:hypothetical protein F4805DRAFT_441191 [Annulohypoxylon moriforme]|nr:hypothetical protein F4805DRAFT_441191 [Annulohypoxylon moriforme]
MLVESKSVKDHKKKPCTCGQVKPQVKPQAQSQAKSIVSLHAVRVLCRIIVAGFMVMSLYAYFSECGLSVSSAKELVYRTAPNFILAFSPFVIAYGLDLAGFLPK